MLRAAIRMNIAAEGERNVTGAPPFEFFGFLFPFTD